MKLKELMTMFIAYIRTRRNLLIFYGIWNLIIVVVLYLYNIAIETAGYGFLLVSTAAAVYVCLDFYYFNKKHWKLMRILNCKSLVSVSLPNSRDLIESDYLKLILRMQEEQMQLTSQWDQKMTDLMDYYTLWAHQIKTPIAAMKLILEEMQDIQNQLKSEDGPGQHRASLRVSLQELFKIERYVESAIHYARLESVTSDFRFETVELDRLVKQAVKKFAPIFIYNRIALQVEPIQYNVLTDEKWLVFVLEQILSNALKYTPQGSISIYRIDNALVIEDTGVGIQAEDLPRVFEKGFTGYNGRMDKKSTGIGLYLCKQILNQLSHTIEISSQIDVGTKVIIYLTTM